MPRAALDQVVIIDAPGVSACFCVSGPAASFTGGRQSFIEVGDGAEMLGAGGGDVTGFASTSSRRAAARR